MKEKMVIDAAGEAFIRLQEGCENHLYDDSGGNCTCGVGHLVHLGPTGSNLVAEEPYVNGLTEIQINELLMHDVATAEDAVNAYVEVQLNQYQFNALVDFTYECGGGALLHSTLLSLLNQGNYAAVPGQLMRWVYSEGKVSQDMVNRRNMEVALWVKVVDNSVAGN